MTKSLSLAERTLAAISSTAPVIAALKQQSAEMTARRRSLVAQLTELERSTDDSFPKLDAAVAKAEAEFKRLEKLLLAAQAAAMQAMSAKNSASFAYSNERDRLEGLLKAEADPAISGFRHDMIDELQLARKTFVAMTQSVRHPVTGAVTERMVNNSASIAARVLAINNAIEEAETLRLEPDQTLVPGRLAALRAALPAVTGP